MIINDNVITHYTIEIYTPLLRYTEYPVLGTVVS